MLATNNNNAQTQDTFQECDDFVMTASESNAAFDAASRRYLNMSGVEFLRKWNAGFFKGKRELAAKVDAVSILLPLIER